MAIQLGLFKVLALTAGGVGSAAFGSGMAYVFQDQLDDFFDLFTTQYDHQYVLVQIKEPISSSKTPTLFDKRIKQYFCQFDKTPTTDTQEKSDESSSIKDEDCVIYRLSASTEAKSTGKVNWRWAITDAYKMLINERLVADDYAILKVSKDIVKSFATTGTNSIQLLSSTDSTHKFAKLDYVYDLKHKAERRKLPKLITNKFLARVTATGQSSASLTTPLTTPFNCEISKDIKFGCKIHAFNTAKTSNHITADYFNSLKTTITPSTDLKKDQYVIIEFTDEYGTFEDFRNYKIKAFDGNTSLGAYEFDQILYGEITTTNPTLLTGDVNREVYIASRVTPKNGTTGSSQTSDTGEIKSYRCKYTTTNIAFDNVVNYDDTCKLYKIKATDNSSSSSTNPKIVPFEKVSSSYEPAGQFLTSSEDTFYKLIIDQNKLHNLKFPIANAEVTVEVTAKKEDGTLEVSKTANFTLKQKLFNDKFEGKSDMLLAKVKSKADNLPTSLTESKCSWSEDIDVLNQFDCSLYTATEDGDKKYENMTIATSATTTATDTALSVDKYFVITLAKPVDVYSFDKSNSLYYHIKNTADASKNTSIEFTPISLMSGEPKDGQKAIFLEPLTNPSSPTTQPAQA